MLRNYIKIAIKVLLRKKFFTFVSLFGISFTLMILIIVSAFYDSTFGPYGPEKKGDRLLFVSGPTFKNEDHSRTAGGNMSYYFAEKNIASLKNAEKVSISSDPTEVICYKNDKKLELELKHTDHPFWEILEFDFIKGRPINKNDIETGNKVAVITKKTSLKYFQTTDCIGKNIDIRNVPFMIIGVVEDVTISKYFSYSDIYVPVTTATENLKAPKLLGGLSFTGIILAKSNDDFETIKDEYQKNLKSFQFPPSAENFSKVESSANTMLKSRMSQGDSVEEEEAFFKLFTLIIGVIIFLFMSFPAINLVNINITRIVERASEIGIRKTFGASKKTLMVQFIIENIIITLLGGIIGFVLAAISIYLINNSGVIPNLIISMNMILIVYTITIILIFGLLSGVYPAWKISKLNIVETLNLDN